ncbi:MAG: D-glycero-beta-D-manno-heptose 1-phosphate adenylyltransferase [Chitinophagaceae bacterium]|nr:MAG: D-glycero-beta-D-manno-heptose 1-phosphate adenylyltransferase [Chitinophagaceae bacterium]
MKAPFSYRTKLLTPDELQKQVARWRVMGKTIAFTNGCFDILHAGHIASLSAAATEADYLVVGVNSDASVKRLKGESRPVNDQDSRSAVLASLLMVDAVVIFDADTPRDLIASFLPDALVKGGDYKVEDVAGAAEVQAAGGRVVINPILNGFSTTGIIEKLRH